MAWRRSVWASAGLLYLGAVVPLVAPLPAHAAPPLPTPCAGGACGTHATPTPFVTSGQAGVPVVNGQNMTVTQQSDRAILNWADFNVANGYSVTFAQPSATAQALNRIWSGDPSVIAGKLTANGQVMLVNQNGIVFDRGAQVNTGALTASTLNITDERFQAGVLSAGPQGRVFGDGLTKTGEVEVRAGAQLEAASGGRIVLLGSRVTNAGTIKTPDGQAILAAGKSVYLAASTDPALRGLLIEVDSSTIDAESGLPGAPDPSSSQISNTGEISAPRGNVTVAGLIVNQAGRVSATTSVSQNGSIYLLAGDTSSSATQPFFSSIDARDTMLPNHGGALTLAPGSVTEVVADPTDTGTITTQNESQFIASEVNLVGKTIVLQGNATVRAPAGKVTINAAESPLRALTDPPTAPDGSRVYLDAQSRIDASGLREVSVDATRNLLTVRLATNDLQDVPLQRDGFLRGRTVVVDARTGSTLFKIAPYAGSIKHSVQEELTRGGSITIRSTGDVITREGSSLDVSGGSIAYRGGMGPATTRLLGADGKAYDIATAPADIQYVGFASSYNHLDQTWGVATSVASQVLYSGYTDGADAGSLSVLGPNLYLRGIMEGFAFQDPYQRDPSGLTLGGALVIGDIRRRGLNEPQEDLRAPSLVFVDGITDALGADFDPEVGTLTANFRSSAALSPQDLAAGGFSRITALSNGAISVESALRLAAGGRFEAIAQSIAIDAPIDIAGGSVSLQATSRVIGPSLAPHDIVLGQGASIDVSGRWTNDLPTAPGAPGAGSITLAGGSVSLRAQDDVRLLDDSGIDVSGGAQLTAGNKLVTGRAGSISLMSNDGVPAVAGIKGSVRIGEDVQLRGASFAPGQGGTLTIRSGTLTIGDNVLGTDGELRLSEEFIDSGTGGFSRFDLTGALGVAIGATDDAVHLDPLQRVVRFTGDSRQMATGSDLSAFTELQAPLDEQRVAVDLSIGSSATGREVVQPGIGDVVLAAGSSISTGPGGSVTLAVRGSLGSMSVLGDIATPGGSIRLQLGGSLGGGSDYGYLDLGHGGYVQQLRLGAQADLDARGVARVSTLNPLGLRQGKVLDGGSVSLIANKGFIVTEAGSSIDVSASSAVLDLDTGGTFVATTVAGDAGSIAIDAREGLVLGGTLAGRAAQAGGSGGGTLSIGLGAVPGVPGSAVGDALYDQDLTLQINDPSNPPPSPYPTGPRVLSVSAAAASELSADLQSGRAAISARTLASGGFDNLALKSNDVVEFSDSVALRPNGSLVIDAPILRVANDALVKLAASRVAIGYYLNDVGATQSRVDPFHGGIDLPSLSTDAGRLIIGDELTRIVDIRGSSVLDNVESTRIQSAGDVRLGFAGQSAATAPYASGSLYTAGDLVVSARQVYPTTATRFDINTPGTVSIGPAGTADPVLPLSAGGDLRITAHRIEQLGVLRAPLGSIRLTAVDQNGVNGRVTLGPGSLTSVSAEGALLPFGLTLNGIQYAYDFGTQGVTAGVTLVGQAEEGKAAIPLPSKEIRIDAAEVVIAKDASGAGGDARLDLSGGGDLYAYEFIAGPGGSRDVLAPGSGRQQFAILPALGEGIAPLDFQYQSGTNIPGGRSIVVSGVPGVPDGTYTLLPARYALLPGAYAVQVVATDSDAAMQSAVALPDGSYLAAARMATAGTSQIDSRTSTIRLTPGSVLRTQSQYNETGANAFFSGDAATHGTVAPPLPVDAGQLQLASTVRLELGRAIDFSVGQFVTGTGQDAVTHQGIGGVVSIVAPRIAVTDPGAAAVAGQLQLDAEALNELGAQTLILGATRESSTLGDRLVIGSDEVVIGNTQAHALEGAEIILAAGDAVSLDSGSAVTATGATTGMRKPLLVDGDGAVLRASNGEAVSLLRTVTTSAHATLSIADGAHLSASGSLLLDAAGSTAIASGAQVQSPDVTLSSSRVNLGDVPDGTPGLNLTTGLLDQLDAGGLQRLRLNSAQSIDLYGAVQLGSVSDADVPQLELLQLNGGAVLGHGDGDKVLSAGRVELGNAAHVTVGGAGDGTGALEVRAIGTSTAGSGVVALRDGDLAVRGFGSGTATAVTVQAGRELRLAGDGSLSLDVDGGLLLSTPRIAADTGVTQRIEHASGRVDIVASPIAPGVVLPEAGLGASLEIRGTTISQAGTLELPAGVIKLEATAGDLSLASGSTTRAAGVSRLFFDAPAAAPAGRVELISRTGDVVIAQGATVDVSAASTADTLNLASAGTLDVHAAQGAFVVADGTLLGHAAEGGDGADVRLDVGRLASFDTLNATLALGGFNGRNELRVRAGDVNASASTTVDASRFVFSADQGSIRFAGRIDTGGGTSLGPDGGAISLWAANDVDVSGATLDTHAAALEAGERPGRGGDIDIGTRAGAIALGGATFIQTGAGKLADASVDTATHGVLTLRTPRTSDGAGAPAVAITGGDAVALATTRTVVIEGSRAYQATRLSADPDDGANNLSVGTDGAMFLDAQAFSATAPQITEAVFGSRAASLPVQVRAGVEVQSSDDLVLASDWDLAAWRAAGTPVNLSLRAAGDLDLSGSISDGFTNNGGAPATWIFGAPGDAASYRLVAGADLAAADPLSVRSAAELVSSGQDGDLVLRADRLVRTGTGSIALGVAGDLVLEAQTSVIYTAGTPAAPLAAFQAPAKAPTFRGLFNPAYPTGGGHLTVDVGGDIRSAPSGQLVTDWMWRRGRTNADGTIALNQNTSWWTMFDRFQQGIATFGGGDLSVRAGGDIQNLSATVASNGRLAGASGSRPLAENLSVNGGGQLSVQAGGDILSGVFEVDWGNARVHAGGDLGSGRIVSDTNPVLAGTTAGDAGINPIFVLGYGAGTVEASAAGDLHIDAAVNSTALRIARDNRSNVAGLPRPFFYTLDEDSRIDLLSVGGNLYLDNQQNAIRDMASDGLYDPTSPATANLGVYPPSVNAIAMSGDLVSQGFETLPAAGVAVNLLAHGALQPGSLTVREADPALIAGVLRPTDLASAAIDLGTIARPQTPLHSSDVDPVRLVAQSGNINGGFVDLPKAAVVVAGGDIVGLRFNGKNLRDSDVTLLMAGGDIVYATSTNANNALVTNVDGIDVEGPGVVEVLAGGDVNLGNGQGIVTSGNLADLRLPNRGATVIVGAGFGRDGTTGGQRAPAYESFTDAYLAPGTDGLPSPYAKDLIAYVAGLQGVAPETLDAATALDAFRALSAKLKVPLAAKVLTQELSQTGLDHSRLGTDYERGYQAIRTLFPEKDAQDKPLAYDGDINMFFSQIKTQQGGDINLLAPGGSVVVGLPNPPAGLSSTKVTAVAGTSFTVPAEANLGLLVLASGAIGGFASDSFIVNQSRILTLQGGDIILWASEGDIDAGRGAKSASGAPPPVIQTDEKGNVFVNPIGAVSGSGIGQLLTKAGVTAGLVNLIAPKGDVNAGEAGIRVAGNLNIAAVRVIGADNISVSGTSSGVPVSDAGALSGALSGANALGDAGKNASDQLSKNLASSAADGQRLADALKPAFVVVKLFCLGDECEIRQ